MTAGSELQRDPSWKCPDFCVVATSLLTRERPSSQKSRKHAPDQAIAGTTFPNVHHGLRPTPAILLQHPFQPLRNLNDSDVVAINRPAPFSGDLASTKLQHDLQHTGSCRSKSCGGAASKSHNNRAACESPIVDLEGEALCSKSLERCGKPLERSPDALRARREGGVEGQLPSTLQCSAPKLYNDTSAITSPAMPAICKRKMSALEAVSGDVLIQICDFVQERDIVRLSTISPAMLDERLWQQLHLFRYGVPSTACLESLPLARASRLQLQSDYPMHHARLIAIRFHHGRIRSMAPLDGCCSSRLMFAAEALTREDRYLREDEKALRFKRASARRNQHTSRLSMLQDLVSARRASTEERMAMVDMRSAVERHTYAPGCRPKAPQVPPSWRTGHWGRGKGGAKGAARVVSSTLAGVLGADEPVPRGAASRGQ